MIRNFVLNNYLQPADVIIVGKNGWNVLDHYVVYMGEQNGEMFFSVNLMNKGVLLLSEQDLHQYTRRFTPKAINRFHGSYMDRIQALSRANSKIGESYSLMNFNCEHFANFVQFGVSQSQQVSNVVGGAFLALLTVGLFSRSE